ncbi:hypothetical protein [Chryseobacterium sp.]|uniref:hypothetical protein n=1 Tax=Chryseobacterium sp. TaxID=1871047 RepID=UPI0035AEC6E0
MNYHGYNPWETPSEQLITLCENCHEHESSISKEAENTLVRSIKSKRFLSSDLFVLSEGFDNMYVVNCAEVTAYAIRDLFSNEDKMKALVRNYLSEIK